MSVNGGTLTAVSAKLISNAKPNGMRKKIIRNSSGGKMMSHLPRRFSQSPPIARAAIGAGMSSAMPCVMKP